MDPTYAPPLPSALEHFDELLSAPAGEVAVFLDYDGTLTPIAPRPEDAVLAEPTRQVVRELANRCPVAIISGRDIRDVRSLVGVEQAVYAGSHGFDIAGPGGWALEDPRRDRFLPALDAAEAELKEAFESVPGILIERKRFSIAVHHRLAAAEDGELAASAVCRIQSSHPELRVARGKKVLELQPDMEWHKGEAVLWLLDRLRLEGRDVLPFYLGDDLTDEDAFRALQGRGVGIVVIEKPRPTAARYALGSTDEVRSFLEKLAARLA